MSIRDEAVEAMAEAMDAAYNPDRYPILATMFRDYADAGLDAALAVLQPAVPNEVEALEALPVGTVVRIDTRAYVHTAAWEWVETVTGTAYTAAELDAEAVIIYQPEEETK